MKRLATLITLLCLLTANAFAQDKQFLHIKFTPADATLEINGMVRSTENGEYQELLPLGTYSYKLTKDGYSTKTGTISISNKHNTKSVELKLAESITDTKSHAIVTLESCPGADILINNQLVGNSKYQDTLLIGTKYKLESGKPSHKSNPLFYTVKLSDDNRTIKLPDPTPLYGQLKITSNFPDAEIYIDEEYIGKTPCYASKVLIGEHVVTMKYMGYNKSQTIDIKQWEHIDVFFEVKYGSLAISSAPSNAKLYINDKHIGYTPKFITELIPGKYTVKFEFTDNLHEAQTYTVDIKEEEIEQLHVVKSVTPPRKDINKKALFTSAPNFDNKDVLEPQTSSQTSNNLETGHSQGNVKEGKQKGTANAQVRGRSVICSLPEPDYDITESGTVVVAIKVDRNGTVVSATAGHAGTNLTSKAAWDAAVKAALKTQFNLDQDAPEYQFGTITYVFSIRE